MSRRSPEVRLRHMLDHAREAATVELPGLIETLQTILPPETPE
jgi:hypothetical protein